jgi:hypothetical protein
MRTWGDEISTTLVGSTTSQTCDMDVVGASGDCTIIVKLLRPTGTVYNTVLLQEAISTPFNKHWTVQLTHPQTHA